MKKIKTIVVDDHPLFRRGVVELLIESGLFEVIKDYDRALELVESLPMLAPDLLLLDLNMPEMSGIEALRRLRQPFSSSKIVMLTVSMDSDSVVEAISAGADGYLLKDSDPDQILTQLERVLEGKIAITETGVSLLAQSLRASTSVVVSDAKDAEGLLDELTERERQTFALIAKGMSNKLIARELGISDSTVKVYVKSLLRKLGLNSRLELAAWNHKHQVFPSES